MDLKLDDKIFKIGKGEHVYDVRAPSVTEMREHRNEIKAASPEDASGVIQSFVAKMGLPLEIVEKLDSHNLTAIYELLLGIKKN